MSEWRMGKELQIAVLMKTLACDTLETGGADGQMGVELAVWTGTFSMTPHSSSSRGNRATPDS